MSHQEQQTSEKKQLKPAQPTLPELAQAGKAKSSEKKGKDLSRAAKNKRKQELVDSGLPPTRRQAWNEFKEFHKSCPLEASKPSADQKMGLGDEFCDAFVACIRSTIDRLHLWAYARHCPVEQMVSWTRSIQGLFDWLIGPWNGEASEGARRFLVQAKADPSKIGKAAKKHLKRLQNNDPSWCIYFKWIKAPQGNEGAYTGSARAGTGETSGKKKVKIRASRTGWAARRGAYNSELKAMSRQKSKGQLHLRFLQGQYDKPIVECDDGDLECDLDVQDARDTEWEDQDADSTANSSSSTASLPQGRSREYLVIRLSRSQAKDAYYTYAHETLVAEATKCFGQNDLALTEAKAEAGRIPPHLDLHHLGLNRQVPIAPYRPDHTKYGPHDSMSSEERAAIQKDDFYSFVARLCNQGVLLTCHQKATDRYVLLKRTKAEICKEHKHNYDNQHKLRFKNEGAMPKRIRVTVNSNLDVSMTVDGGSTSIIPNHSCKSIVKTYLTHLACAQHEIEPYDFGQVRISSLKAGSESGDRAKLVIAARNDERVSEGWYKATFSYLPSDKGYELKILATAKSGRSGVIRLDRCKVEVKGLAHSNPGGTEAFVHVDTLDVRIGEKQINLHHIRSTHPRSTATTVIEEWQARIKRTLS